MNAPFCSSLHLLRSDHPTWAPLPKSLANAGGIPISGLPPVSVPSLLLAQLVIETISHGSRANSPNPVRSVWFSRVYWISSPAVTLAESTQAICTLFCSSVSKAGKIECPDQGRLGVKPPSPSTFDIAVSCIFLIA